MKLKIELLISSLVIIMMLSSCAKEVEDYNKPALFWYSEIVKSISNRDISKADNYYSSLQGEHIGSPLLPEATLILAVAHMYYQEYLLSQHFLDEYIKRYANGNEREFAEFLKIKAKYMSLPHPRRDQILIKDAILDAKNFEKTYPNSSYYSMVDTMLTNLYMSEASLNEIISSLYDRIDKPRAAKYYRGLKKQNWIKWNDINRAKTPWYREWFEGNGTPSWYAFLIPDTKNVVSRNSVIDTNETLKGNK